MFESLASGLTGLSVGTDRGDDEEESRGRWSPDRGVVVVAGDPSVTDVIDLCQRTAAPCMSRCATGRARSSRATASCLGRSCSWWSMPRSMRPSWISSPEPGSSGWRWPRRDGRRSPWSRATRSSGRDLTPMPRPAEPDVVCGAAERREPIWRGPRPGIPTWVVDPPRTGLSDAVRAAALARPPGSDRLRVVRPGHAGPRRARARRGRLRGAVADRPGYVSLDGARRGGVRARPVVMPAGCCRSSGVSRHASTKPRNSSSNSPVRWKLSGCHCTPTQKRCAGQLHPLDDAVGRGRRHGRGPAPSARIA